MLKHFRMSARLSVLVVGVAAVVAAAGAFAFSAHGATTRSMSGIDGKRIGVIELYNNPFWVDAVNGLKSVGGKYHWHFTALNSNGDAATQASNVTNISSAQVDGAVIGPVAPAGALADLNRLKSSGAAVICLDSCAAPKDAPKVALGWTTTSGAALGNGAGKAAVAYIKSTLHGKAKIAMVVCDSLGPVCSLRHDAINAQLKKVPGAKVLATQDAFQTEKAEPKVVDMLTAHPDVNVVITNNQGGTEGAVAAVKQLGLQGKVVVFGIDMTNVTAQALLAPKPILLYTVAQNSYREGQVAAQMLIDKWTGKAIKPFKYVVPVQEFKRGDTAAIEAYMKAHK